MGHSALAEREQKGHEKGKSAIKVAVCFDDRTSWCARSGVAVPVVGCPATTFPVTHSHGRRGSSEGHIMTRPGAGARTMGDSWKLSTFSGALAGRVRVPLVHSGTSGLRTTK